jgi:hypothetical protein
MLAVDLLLVRRSQYSLAGGTCHNKRSRTLKTGFFGQVRELKIQRKNPGSGLRKLKMPPWDFTPYKCTSKYVEKIS